MNFLILPGQLRLALLLCYGGLAGGLVYDVCSLGRKVRGLGWLMDLLFSLFSCALLGCILGWMGEDRVRPAAVLFFAAGFFLYRLGVHRSGMWLFRQLHSRKKQTNGEQ